jgi:hypothetical protein
MSSFVALVFSLKMVPESEKFEVPVLVYSSTLIPMIIGFIVWLSIPKLTSSTIASTEKADSRSIVSIGCFLIGLFWVSGHLPNFIYAIVEYKKVASIEHIGKSMASDQITNLVIIGSRFLIGLFLMFFSVKIANLFNLIAKR